MRVVVDGWAWLPKTDLTPDQVVNLERMLTVRPTKSADYPGDEPPPILLFEHRDQHLGIPRSYFFSNRRPVHSVELQVTEGSKDWWPAEFVGALRPEQRAARDEVVSLFRSGTLGGIVMAKPGWGKCLGIGTLVLMFDGETRPVEEVREGDLLMGPDSLPRCVLSTTRGTGPLYEIVPFRGESWVCNDAHVLTLVHSATGEVVDIEVGEYLKLSKTARQSLQQFAPEQGVDFPPVDLPELDFYSLGIGIRSASEVPHQCLTASRADRLALLAGFVDSGGYFSDGCFDLVQTQRSGAEAIALLARSLGFWAGVAEYAVGGKVRWNVKLSGNFSVLPMRTRQEAESPRPREGTPTRMGFDVRFMGTGEYAGFTLDRDGRFLLGDFTVTHNTVVALAIAEELNVPTLVVVHKEFLMTQWAERISTFLPSARIGVVQQNECSFEGKTVVLGMVHSLAGDQPYPDALWSWPGLVITDESHRIGARTWSAVPPKFSAKYRLGFTATPRRKDGADNVFWWHLGPIIFAAKEERLKPTIKRVWTKFRLVKTDSFNPNLVSRTLLLRFLCASRHRNDLIVDQVLSAVEAGRKCLVLSCRLNHLGLLETELRARWPGSQGGASVGHYVGGRTQEQLARAANARIILATEQYAAEGLDLPALDTLFLTTPMSDVEQAVGRILRPHHGKKAPIVVDFRDDSIPMFEAMGRKRDKFYSKVQ